jgi:hypothetical protein
VRSQADAQAFAIESENGCVGNALLGHHFLKRGQPMPVVDLAGIGIVGGARFADLGPQRGGPFLPGEQPGLMQSDGDGEGARLPRLAKDATVLVAGGGRSGNRSAVMPAPGKAPRHRSISSRSGRRPESAILKEMPSRLITP